VHQPQRFQRLATAVDQVAAEPQGVLRRVEADLLQQPLGDVIAALQVADRPHTHRSASVSVQGTRDGQHERATGAAEFGAIVGDHVVVALHGPVIGPQHDTGRVTEVFTGAQPWLLADHPVAIDMLDATIGIGDAPVACDQARGNPPLVVDADRVGERASVRLPAD
jgi:hypothetical protein